MKFEETGLARSRRATEDSSEDGRPGFLTGATSDYGMWIVDIVRLAGEVRSTGVVIFDVIPTVSPSGFTVAARSTRSEPASEIDSRRAETARRIGPKGLRSASGIIHEAFR